MNISPQLIKECKSNNRLSQKALYLQLLPYLRAVCIRYIYHTNSVKDVLQESFILIFKNLNKFDPDKGAFHKWAVTITINATFNYNRRMTLKNQDSFEIDLHDVPQIPVILENLSIEASLQMLKKMPADYFEVFNLYIIDGYDHKEIASMLNINADLSRKRLSRARTWLKKTYGKQTRAGLSDKNFDIQTKKPS